MVVDSCRRYRMYGGLCSGRHGAESSEEFIVYVICGFKTLYLDINVMIVITEELRKGISIFSAPLFCQLSIYV